MNNSLLNPVRTNFWSVPISIITLNQCSDLIRGWALQGIKKRVYCCSMNDIIYARQYPEAAERISQANVAAPDGMPLVWHLKRKGVPVTRVYGPDLMLSVLKKTENLPIKHFFYGSSQKTIFRLEKEIRQKFPNIKLAGFFSPPYRRLSSVEENRYIRIINESDSQILWVGLGSEKQIELAHNWESHLNPCVIITVGAAFDFLARTKRQAPKWIGNIGLEWFFRLTQEPRRLGKRYLNIIFKSIYFFIKYGPP